MRITPSTVAVTVILAIVAPAILTGCNEPTDSAKTDYGCDQGYELVFDANVTIDNALREYRFWLIEDNDDFLSGKVLDKKTEKSYIAVGEKREKDSYILSFTPGQTYLDYPCHAPISVTFDLEDLSGTMGLYCDLVEFESFPAFADVECDNTGITL